MSRCSGDEPADLLRVMWGHEDKAMTTTPNLATWNPCDAGRTEGLPRGREPGQRPPFSPRRFPWRGGWDFDVGF